MARKATIPKILRDGIPPTSANLANPANFEEVDIRAEYVVRKDGTNLEEFIGTGGGGTVRHFDTIADRNQYFSDNPLMLTAGISVGVGDPITVYTFDGVNWLTGALAFRGPAGHDGADGLPGSPGTPGANGQDGLPGVDGQDGQDGFSPMITVKTNTATEYVLTITTATGSFDTPNLKGAAGNGSVGGNVDSVDIAAGELLFTVILTDPANPRIASTQALRDTVNKANSALQSGDLRDFTIEPILETELTNGAVTDSKIGTRSVSDQSAADSLVPTNAKNYTSWLQWFRNNLRYVFETLPKKEDIDNKVAVSSDSTSQQYANAASVWNLAQEIIATIPAGGLGLPMELPLESELLPIGNLYEGDLFIVQNMDITAANRTGKIYVGLDKKIIRIYDRYNDVDGESLILTPMGQHAVSTTWLNIIISTAMTAHNTSDTAHENRFSYVYSPDNKPTPADIGAATEAQGLLADGALQRSGGEIIGNLNVQETLSENGERVYSPNNPPPSSDMLLWGINVPITTNIEWSVA